ncbi:MAG: MvaI/BcnI family restriction endonuclease [candidate division WOR-3 bacterium]|nr:MvaI/BcnI family restriction endonuclease [candidate division WOR-3 bacterium]
MELFSKEDLVEKLKEIRKGGWIPNARPGNPGGVGNTLEDLLEIEENNLPIPNAAEWELKAQRIDTSSLTTLFHMEPSPRALKFVPCVFLPLYGWPHKKAGGKYSPTEMSFRQTISGSSRSNRGFTVIIDRDESKVKISFDAKAVAPKHSEWLKSVEEKVGLGELNPQPYWGFTDLFHKAGIKLKNCFYVKAERKRIGNKEHFWYKEIMILTEFSFDQFLNAIEQGFIYVDFDARTGHNHGTKFRLKQDKLPFLYKKTQKY